jgi:hypothetical protein
MAGQAPPGWARKVLHAGLAFSDGVLEGCGAMPGEYDEPERFCVMLRPGDVKVAERIFSALAEEGRADTDCGDFLGTAVWQGC